MVVQGCSAESGSLSHLFEAGAGVNAPADAFGQSPAHLAACGGEAFFLLWQLQTGVNLNQQTGTESNKHSVNRHVGEQDCTVLFPFLHMMAVPKLCSQDCLGEAPIHKAAKAGSLECLALLVAGHAKTDLCNNSGQTAADLALAHDFLECAKFFTTIQHTQTMRQRGQSGSSVTDRHGLLSEDPAAQKQESETSRSISRKRRRPDALKRNSL